MEIIRGTTPTITANIKDEIDFSAIEAIWIYISQRNRVIIDKTTENVDVDSENKKFSITLTQEETLRLEADTSTILQIRILVAESTAMATKTYPINVLEIYKGGIIS